MVLRVELDYSPWELLYWIIHVGTSSTRLLSFTSTLECCIICCRDSRDLLWCCLDGQWRAWLFITIKLFFGVSCRSRSHWYMGWRKQHNKPPCKFVPSFQSWDYYWSVPLSALADGCFWPCLFFRHQWELRKVSMASSMRSQTIPRDFLCSLASIAATQAIRRTVVAVNQTRTRVSKIWQQEKSS